MTQLSPDEFKALREAIQSAYRSRDDLKIVVREELGLLLNEIAGERDSLRVTVANLIEWAEAEGELQNLLQRLPARSGNPELRAVCDQLSKRRKPSRPSSAPLRSSTATVKRRRVLTDFRNWLMAGTTVLVGFVGARFLSNGSLDPEPPPTPSPTPLPTPRPTQNPTPATPQLQSFEAQTVKLDETGKVIDQEPIVVQYFTEQIGDVGLEMIPIQGGTYLRGSPDDEVGRDGNEEPQFPVTVPDFWMGRYTVTQVQWRAVAQLPKVDRDLKADPSYFKGARRPVDQVSWDDAQEFCARLSRAMGATYRLPSEAEWEYACRAGTTEPFAFGETLTTDFANFDGKNATYAKADRGEDLAETINVGMFQPNAWGLYDMHGNVWEWCEDAWDDNYNGTPVDGSAHIDSSTESRLLRGGSWNIGPGYCRSACRSYSSRVKHSNRFGFRVVCDSPSAL